jgi:FixJ family two-component response regulator
MVTFPTIDRPRPGTPGTAIPRPTVFIVDDDVMVRESLEKLVEASAWQPRTYASAGEFLACPRVPVPSCLILDAVLPEIDGLDVQRRLAADRCNIPIIFITRCGDVSTGVKAMKAGAVEFLTKPFDDDVILAAMSQALERSRRALEHAARIAAVNERYVSLTARERQVMALVAAGLLNKQVGGELGISEITVKAHRGQVMRKMKADSLPALVHMAARLGVAPGAFA